MNILLLYNARVYTMDPRQPTASALAVIPGDRSRGLPGRILAVGESDRLRGELEGRATLSDLEGRVVIPGLIDAHLHLQGYALNLRRVNCETPSLEECLARVAARAREVPPGNWIRGHGWNQNDWEGRFPAAADLDRAAPDHPVYLTAKSLHAAWANSLALKMAGLGIQPPDPPDGRISRDSQGMPTGILFEGAMDLVSRTIPEPSIEDLAQAIQAAQDQLWRLGLTSVHDFDRQRCFSALQVLHARHLLGLRVVKSLPVESLPHAVALGLRSGYGDDFLRIGSVKAFADGALGPRTAAMLQPYEDEPDNRGILLLDGEQVFEQARLASEHGLSMAVHAIGDLANHEVLNAYAQVRAFEAQAGLPARRHRIEHVQVLHQDDLTRLAELDVIASMQPVHAPSDMPAADRFWGSRAALSYAWKSLLATGARLAFGSDAPVESPNPFWGLHAAVTRQRQDGSPGPEGWYPAQRLALTEALHAYTRGAAYAAGLEDRLGRLAPGYLADLVMLDQDPLTSEPEALRDLLPTATMVGGEWVHGEAL